MRHVRAAYWAVYRLADRLNSHIERRPLPAYLILVAGIAIAFVQIERSFDASENEKSARTEAQGQINFYVCVENNRQDSILAELLRVSLASSSVPGRELTDPEQHARRVFERAIAALEQAVPCREVVTLFLEAARSEDYRALRRVLEAEDRTLDIGAFRDACKQLSRGPQREACKAQAP